MKGARASAAPHASHRSRSTGRHQGFTIDEVYAYRARHRLPGGVVDLAIGGYGVSLEPPSDTIDYPSKTKPILARIASGVVELLPGPYAAWRIVG